MSDFFKKELGFSLVLMLFLGILNVGLKLLSYPLLDNYLFYAVTVILFTVFYTLYVWKGPLSRMFRFLASLYSSLLVCGLSFFIFYICMALKSKPTLLQFMDSEHADIFINSSAVHHNAYLLVIYIATLLLIPLMMGTNYILYSFGNKIGYWILNKNKQYKIS